MIVKINISKAVATTLAALPAQADKQRIIRGLGAAALAYWKRQAQSGLKSSSRDYVAGLQLDANAETASIVLVGTIPNMIENGWPGGDLRQWLLKGKNAKMGKNGPYNTVPFRHGTPGTGARNVGNEMPKPIHQVAKTLAATISRPGTGVGSSGGVVTVWGQRLNPNMPMKQAARAILERKEKPWHATSIYMDMVRKAQPTPKGLQTTGYQTFRRISMTKNDQRSWLHPGIKPRRFADATRQYVEKIAQQYVLQAIGKT